MPQAVPSGARRPCRRVPPVVVVHAFLLALAALLPHTVRAGFEGCTFEEHHEVVGVAPDGSAYALRRVLVLSKESPVDPEELSLCSYPKVGRLDPQLVELKLCRPDVECEKTWTIYAQGEPGTKCTTHAQAKAQLAQAKAALEAAKVRLDKPPEPIDAIPIEMMILYKINTDVKLGMVKHHHDCDLVASAPGYGSVTLATVGQVPCLHWSLRGASLSTWSKLFFYHGANFVGCTERTGAMRLHDVAAKLINARGFRSHRKKDYAASAADFARAFELDPKFAQAAFNHACALALLGNKEEAIKVLGQALALDRATFVKKARKDPDLDSLRGMPEFKKLVSGG